MKKIFISMSCFILVLFYNAGIAAERYVEAEIARAESCTHEGGRFFIYLKNSEGTVPSANNGCSNDINLPFIRVATSGSWSEVQDSMVNLSLAAYAMGKRVRIRYDDANNSIISIAFK